MAALTGVPRPRPAEPGRPRCREPLRRDGMARATRRTPPGNSRFIPDDLSPPNVKMSLRVIHSILEFHSMSNETDCGLLSRVFASALVNATEHVFNLCRLRCNFRTMKLTTPIDVCYAMLALC